MERVRGYGNDRDWGNNQYVYKIVCDRDVRSHASPQWVIISVATSSFSLQPIWLDSVSGSALYWTVHYRASSCRYTGMHSKQSNTCLYLLDGNQRNKNGSSTWSTILNTNVKLYYTVFDSTPPYDATLIYCGISASLLPV